MTNREFYNAVIAETKNADLAEFAVEALGKLDARNAKRAAQPSKKQMSNEPIIEALKASLGEEPKTASELAVAVGVSTQKASSLLSRMDGISVSEIKVKGKGKVKGYAL